MCKEKTNDLACGIINSAMESVFDAAAVPFIRSCVDLEMSWPG